MIIYGSKAVHLQSEQSQTATCPSCGTKGSLLLSVFRRHAHVFWIPMFPIGKIGGSQCLHCQNTLKPKAMPESIRREYDDLKRNAKGPLWQFVGLAIVAMFIAWGSYSSGEEQKRELQFLATPQVGDIYEYKVESGSFSSFKVQEVFADSLYIVPNEYEISNRSKVYKINKPENFSQSLYSIPRARVEEMYHSGEIFNILR